MSRRQLLKACGYGALSPLAFNPLQALVGSLVDGLITKAEASSSGVTPPRNLINYHLSGAAPRWYWDGFLSPYKNITPVRNPLVNTKIVNGIAQYGTTPVSTSTGTMYLPPIWASQIPLSNGGTGPMSALLESMLTIRGIYSNDVGHPDGAASQTRPLASAPSLMGLVADASSAVVQAVGAGQCPTVAFAARSSGQTVVTNDSNPIGQIMSPFDRSQDYYGYSYMGRRAAMDTVIQQALSSLGAYANGNYPGSSALYSMRNTAEQLLKVGIGNATSMYPTLLAKYQKLIATCGAMTIPGVSDANVPLPARGNYGIPETLVNGLNTPTYVQNSDVRTVVTASSYPDYMAENFAIAESLITQGLSQSIMIGSGYIEGLNYEGSQLWKTNVPITSGSYWGHDEHTSGSLTSLLVNSFMYQCLSACLFEFISVLKAKGLYTETAIFITGDFNRYPRFDIGTTSGFQAGSDHDPASTVMTVFSGALSGPNVIGNIVHGGSTGDWGTSAVVNNMDGANRQIIIPDATSTIAGIARVTPPFINNPPLVTPSGTPTIPPGEEIG